MNIEKCRAGDLPEVIKIVDKEFIIDKKKSISLAKRFPKLLSLDNLENIYVVKIAEKIVATTLVKLFSYHQQKNTWQGAMLGEVCTLPNFRGKGIGKFLLEKVCHNLQAKSIDFGVLWTKIPEFYSKFGWQIFDKSLFTQIQGLANNTNQAELKASYELKISDYELVEGIRRRHLDYKVIRNKNDYQRIPLPVETVLLFTANQEERPLAYALVGQSANAAYLYELCGETIFYEKLWQQILTSFTTVYINDQEDSNSAKWFNQKITPNWEFQTQTMALDISGEISKQKINLRDLHIAYFDRI